MVDRRGFYLAIFMQYKNLSIICLEVKEQSIEVEFLLSRNTKKSTLGYRLFRVHIDPKFFVVARNGGKRGEGCNIAK